MSRFWSAAARRLVPYVPGEQPRGARFVKLNTNENPHGPSPRVTEAIAAATGEALRLYPDPGASELCEAVGTSLGLDAAHVFAGNGSDEVLAHAFGAFFDGGAPILFADITYSFYASFCALYGLAHREIPLEEDFTCDPDAFTGPCCGVVIANPNAPTGIEMPREAVERLLDAHPGVVVIVDEAYVDFGARSAVDLVPDHDNLLVVRTFSKGRALAGLRVGLAIGQPPLIEGLRRMRDSFNSYPLGRLALAGALASWQDPAWLETTRRQVMADRERLALGLRERGFAVLPSAANFVFASHPRMAAETLLATLRAEGILVRHFRRERIANWLRISVGTTEECAALLAALDRIAERV